MITSYLITVLYSRQTQRCTGAGRVLIKVDPRGTSQRCSGCGELVPKKLSERIHCCQNCGLILDRDENAARNIQTLGQSVKAITWSDVGSCVALESPDL